MAFGSSQKKFTSSKSSTSTTNKVFIPPVLKLSPGIRTFRLLPAMPLTQTRLGDGLAYELEPEIDFFEYWIEVRDKDRTRPQRVFVGERFDNYIWNTLYAHLPAKVNGKNNPERKLAKPFFATNVYDKTPVVQAEDGFFIYPNQEGKYFYNGKEYNPETKKPRNTIMILEGSNGAEGGDHTMGKLTTLIKNMTDEDKDGNEIPLPAYGYDIRISSVIPQGGEPKDVTRSVVGFNVKPLPDQELVWSLPRYQLADFHKPYPDEALKALLDGEDVTEVFTQFGIQKWVKLPEVTNDDEVPF